MYSEDDIQYALENTEVIYEPDRRIDTFGTTRFEFQIITENMDAVNEVIVRNGRIEAQKPLILKPNPEQDFNFEGFGPQAQAFGHWLKNNSSNISLLKYGFHFRRDDVEEHLVHESFLDVKHRLLDEAKHSGNPLRAVIQGVEDAWEICLLRFTVEMIVKSQGINLFDFKRKGLL